MTDDPKTKQTPEDLKTREKPKSGKLYWLLIVLAVVLFLLIIIFAMFFHRPSYYQPLDVADKGVMSVYLTNQLLPDFYNGVQYQQPFDLVVTQKGINDVLAHFYWPQRIGSLDISDPMVFFTPSALVLMGTVSVDGAECVATIVAEPEIDVTGLLNLRVTVVKLGAVDITPLARALTARLYQQQANDKDSFADKAVCSILYGEPFDHVFRVEGKKVRLSKITLESKKLTLRFDPVFDEEAIL